MFVPRIGTEVVVQFIEADIDRPLIAGQLHNGQDRPPFAAGVDSGVNHPGVISGLASRALDGAGANRWVLDDATGQLRTSLHCAYAAAELALGAGLLVGTAARPGRYGNAEGTQMGAAEALAQLQAGRALGQRLGQAAQAGQAQGLPSHDDTQALDQAAQAIDPQRDGTHAGPVNGQPAFKPGGDGRSPGTDPVETFARPQLVLHSAASQAWAGQATSVVAHDELHQAAAHTQVVWHPLKRDGTPDQLQNARADTFAKPDPGKWGVQFPDMVEGGAIKNSAGQSQPHGVRVQVNDPRIEGPLETGWGFKDFEDQHDLIGLPNPMKE